MTLQELESIKTSGKKDEEIKYKARKALHILDENPNRYHVVIVDKNILDKNNLVNMIVLLKQEDITRSLVMDLFGSFNGESLCHHYDTFEVPAGAFTFTNGKGKKLSNKNPFITTFGIWIFNIFLIQGFDFSFLFGGYINSEINAGKYKDINSTLVYALAEDRISIEKYKKFILYSDFVMPWETFLSPTQSEAILCCTKEVNKLKAKLIKENEEAIKNGDPVVADEIRQLSEQTKLDGLSFVIVVLSIRYIISSNSFNSPVAFFNLL